MNKKISTPLAISIIVVLAVVVGGGIILYKYLYFQSNIISENNLIIPKIVKSKEEYNGRYVFFQNNNPTIFKSIKIEKSNAENFKFTISTMQEQCLGDLNSIANFLGENKAEYINKNNKCKIDFEFFQDVVAIKDNNCFYYHGSACDFSAEYKKIDEYDYQNRKLIKDWDIYKNEEYGFEIKNPKKWYIEDITTYGQGNSDLKIHIQNIYESPIVDTMPNGYSALEITVTRIDSGTILENYGEKKSIKKINIGENQYDASIPFDDPFDIDSTVHSSSLIYIINEGKLYMVHFYSVNRGEYQNSKSIFIEMLSTFKFTN